MKDRITAHAVDNETKARSIRCRYHGWTYDLAGRLRGTPEFEGVADFCKEEQGLVEMAVDVCGSLVWVHQKQGRGGTQSPESLADFLKPFPEKASELKLENLR